MLALDRKKIAALIVRGIADFKKDYDSTAKSSKEKTKFNKITNNPDVTEEIVNNG